MIRRALVLLGAAGVIVALVLVTAADGSRSGHRRPAAGMFTRANLTQAVRSFRRHHGISAQVLDLAVTLRSAVFTYPSRGRPASYEVDLPGPHPPTRGPLLLGVAPYSPTALHGEVPAALLAIIDAEPGLGDFVPDSFNLTADGANTPSWTVTGQTPRRDLIFTATAQGRRLRTVCSQPLPKGPHRSIGC